VKLKSWVALTAITVTLTAGTILVVVHSAEPPRADLLQPEPHAGNALPISRWPLGAPADTEPAGTWSCPKPHVEQVQAQPVQTTIVYSTRPRAIEPPDWLDRPAGSKVVARRGPLTGTHVAILEAGSIVLPPPLRQQLGDLRDASGRRLLYAMPGKDGCVWLTTAEGLMRLSDQIQQTGRTSHGVRQARRTCFAQTEVCDVDRDGQMRIPDHLIRLAGLGQQVMLVGVGDRVELWDVQRWNDDVQRADVSR
jgi:MraZ protein